MHCGFGLLYLGQVHARTKLERRRDLQRRPRTDYTRAVRVGAPSDLYRAPDHVRRNRDRARARGRNHRHAIGIREHLDQTAPRGKTHAQEISGPIRSASAPSETPYSLCPLAALFDGRTTVAPKIFSCLPGFLISSSINLSRIFRILFPSLLLPVTRYTLGVQTRRHLRRRRPSAAYRSK